MNRPEPTATTVFRSDYQPPTFLVPEVHLEFDLAPEATRVTSRFTIQRNAGAEGPLVLDGEELTLVEVRIDGVVVDDARYELERDDAGAQRLTIDGLPDTCEISTIVTIAPERNTTLSGLYRTSGNYCTQCEAQGFRRITFFPDRPDVMSIYRVTIRGDRDACPVLLSNGNRVSEQSLPGDRHELVWHDPHPKPAYLFALVAGDLHVHAGKFTTRSGRVVDLEIWVEKRNLGQCDHALESLRKSMKWDEDVFGLEYDLDLYMIVAVDDFNMGAMENKGLNVFNSKFVLASKETATDSDFRSVEAVIAHEYFHNWTGNRVTCRDWFQLTLKEGLTVFRDQQFTADQTSPAVKRIDDVVSLRSRQFAEDAGPMAHPIRPESYIAMDNFYTATVYDKGAEIIRMYHTRLGDAGFHRGMDLYFKRHDNSAVTCDDFRAAMADANGVDFDLTDRWYSQAGTPELSVTERYSETSEGGVLQLDLEQAYPPLPEGIPGTADRKPVPIPVRLGLIDRDGRPIDPSSFTITDSSPRANLVTPEVVENSAGDSVMLVMTGQRQTWTFSGLQARPVVSPLRGFSAPVRLVMGRDDAELAFLMAHDSDPVNRWDAGQSLAMRVLVEAATTTTTTETTTTETESPSGGGERRRLYLDAIGRQLDDDELDPAYRALLLEVPSEDRIAQEIQACHPDRIHAARDGLVRDLATQHESALTQLYDRLRKSLALGDQPAEKRNATARPAVSTASSRGADSDAVAGQRRLKNTALALLAKAAPPSNSGGGEPAVGVAMAATQYRQATNMTDRIAAFSVLAHHSGPESSDARDDFYRRYKDYPLVIDMWFQVQASAHSRNTFERVDALREHPDFNRANPNRVRALIQAFAGNHHQFHRSDFRGYRMLAEEVLAIDPRNPQLASRLVSRLRNFSDYEPGRATAMREQLQRIAATPGLSNDTAEIVGRALSFTGGVSDA